MDDHQRPLKVLHSFPHRLGKARICTTAWQEIDSAAAAGADMLVMAGDSVRPFLRPVRLRTTLSRGKLRIPYRLLGTMRACMLHDWLVARQLPKMTGQIDIIHAWPLGALNTIKVAKRLGIPVALERCNAHTRFAYEVVQKECEQVGVSLPKDHEHAYNEDILRREEEEYSLADAILCPSDFVVKTFVDQGFPKERLVRFIYGVDENKFFPDYNRSVPERGGLTMIFVGVCAVRKGLHYALEAWLQSLACRDGRFLIAGEFIPAYRDKLAPMLAHPSVEVLGHRDDVPELMRQSDLFVLPSIEEGFGLVCTEAMATGCVPLVSDACTDLCRDMENGMVHPAGDVKGLTTHINLLHERRDILTQLRDTGLRSIPSISWMAAGRSLIEAYRRVLFSSRSS
ncbi:MAG: glycosyltransferase family 4 protein [Deltaproteobacteria bacterium]|nr:glycosyltransferase family 4 protein [Deltaproteobacteria bacterium]MBM4321961.1 glycosyltransferase family 4 protein [Deltaproteobacteria bacterium]